jgi:hypothetical protein
MNMDCPGGPGLSACLSFLIQINTLVSKKRTLLSCLL